MTETNLLLDISRFPSVPLIDVEPALAKAENVGNGLALTETHLLPFAYTEPQVHSAATPYDFLQAVSIIECVLLLKFW